MATILTLCGHEAHVDAEDLERISRYKWLLLDTGFVARARERRGDRPVVYMHNEVMGKNDGLCLIHLDFDGRNNRRDNLKFVSRQIFNQRRRAIGVSGYRGVAPRKTGWAASIIFDGTHHHLGTHATAEAAAHAYDAHARAFYGELAALNFPEVHHA